MNVDTTTILPRVATLACALGVLSTVNAGGIAPPDEKIQVGTGRVAISFDNNRRFFLSEETVITQRGEPVDAEVLIQVGTGRRARFLVADDVDDAITSGTLTSIEFGAQMEGPVTSVAPLTVFNFELEISTDTVLTDVPGDDVANIELGSEVRLAGFFDGQGGFQVTGLEYEDEPLEDWVVTGTVSNITKEGFFIGSQAIAFGGIDPEGCENGFKAGAFVQVEALPQAEFDRGDTITTTTEIECQSDDLGGEPGAVVPAYVEGFITTVSSNSGFSVGEQSIVITPETVFENGDPMDIQPGIRVQVEGQLNTDTGVLSALEVEFAQVRVEAEGPLSDGDINGDSITLLGITMQTTPETEDEDGILGGLLETIQVRVEGFVNPEGVVILDGLENRGGADAEDVSLRAVVETIARPELTVLGVTVDTTQSALFLDDEVETPLDEATFFEAIQVGTEISVEGASYNSAENRLTGGDIAVEPESEGEPDPKAGLHAKGMNNFGIGNGVIIESGDAVFNNGFE